MTPASRNAFALSHHCALVSPSTVPTCQHERFRTTLLICPPRRHTSLISPSSPHLHIWVVRSQYELCSSIGYSCTAHLSPNLPLRADQIVQFAYLPRRT